MLRPGRLLVPYCNKRLRLPVLLGLCLTCGLLLGYLRQQDGYSDASAVPVFDLVQRAAIRTTHDVLKAEAEADHSTNTVDQTVALQPPRTLMPPVPPPFSPHPDFPYRYLINEPHLCEGEVFVINMVPIARTSFAARQRIRALWGNRTVAAVGSLGMRTVFVVGVSGAAAAAAAASQQTQRRIEEEGRAHRDIIQVDFVDSYRNLTLKTLTMLHWTLTHCPHAAWLLKSDEDVFINPFALMSALKHHANASFVCRVNEVPPVCRKGDNCHSKWVVSRDDYQNDTFPSHCSGAAYAVSAGMTKKLYSVANKTHHLFLEDVYVTGILAKAFQPRYIDVRARIKRVTRTFEDKHWNGKVLFTLFSWRVRNELSYTLWDRILEYNNVSRLSP